MFHVKHYNIHVSRETFFNMKKKVILNFWREYLWEKINRIFIYENVPDTIPFFAIEKILMKYGRVSFVKKKGKLYALNSRGIGIGVYSFIGIYPGSFIINEKLGSFASGINRIVTFYNNSSMQSANLLIERYATLLTEIELTLRCGSVVTRSTALVTAGDDRTANAYKEYMNALIEGRYLSLQTYTDLNSLKNEGSNNVYPLRYSFSPQEWHDVLRNVLKDFYSDIGVKTSKEKREREVVSEVDADDSMLLFNIEDMNDNRVKGIAEVNRVFGTNISVRLSGAFATNETGSEVDVDE